MTVSNALRQMARDALEKPGCHVSEADARRRHAGAVALGDAEAVALWARVIWRILAPRQAHSWMGVR